MPSASISPIEQYVIDTVKQKRLDKGVSQKQLACMPDLSFSFIGDVESPKRIAKFNLNHSNKLAEVFECSPKDFLPEKPL